jgi:hypothetical protein
MENFPSIETYLHNAWTIAGCVFFMCTIFSVKVVSLFKDAKRTRRSDNKKLNPDALDAVEIPRIFLAKFIIVSLLVLYAFAIIQNCFSNPTLQIVRCMKRNDIQYAQSTYDPQMRQVISQINHRYQRYNKSLHCDTVECWEELLQEVELLLENYMFNAEKAYEKNPCQPTDEIRKAISSMISGFKMHEWNPEVPDKELKEILLDLLYRELNLAKGQLQSSLGDISIEQLAAFANKTSDVLDKMDQIHHLAFENKADMYQIAKKMDLDHYYEQAQKNLRSFGLPNDVSVVLIALFGEFPASVMTLSKAVAIDYVRQKYKEVVNTTRIDGVESVTSYYVPTKLTVPRFIFETLFFGAGYWIHIAKMWLQGCALEVTCGFYGIVVMLLDKVSELYQQANKIDCFEYKTIRLIRHCFGACQFYLLWIGIIMTGPMLCGLLYTIAEYWYIQLALWFDYPIGMYSTPRWQKITQSLGEVAYNHLFVGIGKWVLLAQLIFLALFVFVKNKHGQQYRYVFRSRDLEADRMAEVPTPRYQKHKKLLSRWQTVKNILWCFSLLRPIVMVGLKFLPLGLNVGLDAAIQMGSVLISQLPELGDLTVAENGLGYFFALGDYASLPLNVITKALSQ